VCPGDWGRDVSVSFPHHPPHTNWSLPVSQASCLVSQLWLEAWSHHSPENLNRQVLQWGSGDWIMPLPPTSMFTELHWGAHTASFVTRIRPLPWRLDLLWQMGATHPHSRAAWRWPSEIEQDFVDATHSWGKILGKILEAGFVQLQFSDEGWCLEQQSTGVTLAKIWMADSVQEMIGWHPREEPHFRAFINLESHWTSSKVSFECTPWNAQWGSLGVAIFLPGTPTSYSSDPHKHIHTQTHEQRHPPCTYTHTQLHTLIHKCVLTHIHIHTCTQAFTSYMYMHIYTCIRPHARTRTRAHAHTHTLLLVFFCRDYAIGQMCSRLSLLHIGCYFPAVLHMNGHILRS
jgi:hypothetical protein